MRRALEELLEASEAVRETRLVEIERRDAELAGELRRLLASSGGPGATGFLEPPAPALTPALPAGPGTNVGPYELVQPLGAGGMGTVWVAEQRSPTRRVALKMLASAPWSRSERWRFEYEAGVLASLQHPSIAQVYSSGVEERGGGELLWFAMELVEGARDIVTWADERGADRAERLAKFGELCRAVEYGHRRGVIHRDLKPANILVDREGHLKLIDFGVARAVSRPDAAPSARTRTGEVVGTLQYMAPEQLSGRPDDVDVRCDVYALGVVLYRLLCGAQPFEFGQASLVEIARRVQQDEPRRPSSLDASLRGDLEWILLKALEKSPARRYGSVTELVDDLQRAQADLPVSARPPSRADRLGKFVRRNRAGVAIAGAAALGLSVAVTGVTSGLFRARAGERSAKQAGEQALEQAAIADRERARAVEQSELATLEATRSQEVLGLVVGLFDAVDDTVDGREVRVADLLDSAVLRYERLGELDPDTELGLRAVLGKMYARLKLHDLARVQLERALDVWPRTRQRPVDRARELESRAHLGRALTFLGEPERGEELLRAAQAELEADGLHELAEGVTLPLLEHLNDKGAYEETRERAEALRGRAAESGEVELEVLATQLQALALSALGRDDQALPLHAAAWEHFERAYGERHWRTVDALVTWSLAEQRAGHLDETERLLELAIPLVAEVRGPTHEMTLQLLGNRAVLAQQRGDLATAVQRMQEVLERYEDAPEASAIGRMTLLNNLGNVLVALQRFEEAEPYLRRGLALSEEAGLAGTLKACQVRFNLGVCLGALLRWEEAEPLLLDGFGCLESELPADHPNLDSGARMIAECYARNGLPEEARRWLEGR